MNDVPKGHAAWSIILVCPSKLSPAVVSSPVDRFGRGNVFS